MAKFTREEEALLRLFQTSKNRTAEESFSRIFTENPQVKLAFINENEAFTDGKVSLAKIGKAMLDSGTISDYNKLLLDGINANITLTPEQLPRLKDLTVTADA